MTETTRAPVDVFEKARSHDRKEQLDAAREGDVLPYFRLMTSEAGPLVEMEGRETIMLGSNNYLGLTGDPRVKAAARDALDRYGTALTGSRLLNGTIPLHVELEREIAEWMGTEDAIVFTTGYQANLGTIGTILEPGETVICDAGDHASILDGCRLSGAKLRPFRHNQMEKLSKMLERANADGGGVLVVVDGVFSMEGDVCPLPEIVERTERHGARLMVDEAHAVGVLGERGAGVSELYGLEDRVDLRMGTFSKSLASCGGFVAGPSGRRWKRSASAVAREDRCSRDCSTTPPTCAEASASSASGSWSPAASRTARRRSPRSFRSWSAKTGRRRFSGRRCSRPACTPTSRFTPRSRPAARSSAPA